MLAASSDVDPAGRSVRRAGGDWRRGCAAGVQAEGGPPSAGVPAAREEDRFEALGHETMSALALTRGCVAELMDFKDVLLQHSLPGALRARLLLLMSRLHRSVSDVQVPAGELSRLTLLYSAHWHRQSEILRSLHEHCQMKQRLLDVATRRLQQLHEQVRRAAHERKLLHWEKMFVKMTATEVLGAKWPNMMASFMEEAAQREGVVGAQKTSSEGFSKSYSDDVAIHDDDDDDDEDDGDDKDMFIPAERRWRTAPAPTSTAPHRREFGSQTDSTPQTDTGAQTDASTQANADTQTDARTKTDAHTQTHTGTHGDAGTQTTTVVQSDRISQTDRISHADTGAQTDTDTDAEHVARPEQTGQAAGTLRVENITQSDAASQTEETPAVASLEPRIEERLSSCRLPTPKLRSSEEPVEGSGSHPQADAWARTRRAEQSGGRPDRQLAAQARRSQAAAHIESVMSAHGRLAEPRDPWDLCRGAAFFPSPVRIPRPRPRPQPPSSPFHLPPLHTSNQKLVFMEFLGKRGPESKSEAWASTGDAAVSAETQVERATSKGTDEGRPASN